jgi:predicted chitinase
MASTVNQLISQYITPIKEQSTSRRKLYLHAIENNIELFEEDIAKKFKVEPGDVVPTIIEAILKSDKKHPSARAEVNMGSNSLAKEYYLYLWDYYVNDVDKFKGTNKNPFIKQPDPLKSTKTKRVVNAKKSNQFVTEKIDEGVLNALGIDDIKDFNYEEYRAFLKEYLMKAQKTNSTSTEEVEKIRNEFIRIKGSVGTFRIRKTKINSKPFTGKIKGFLPGSKVSKKLLKGSTFDSGEELGKILGTLGSINTILKDSIKRGTKAERLKRREDEKKKRSDRENKLERGKKLTGVVNVFKSILKPFDAILDAIKRFIFFTVLGKIFNSLVKWFSDPKNEKKVKTLNRFIKDWWPAILAAVLLFLTPLGSFIVTTLKIVKGMATGIIKLVPKLLKAISGLKNIVGKLGRAGLKGASKLIRNPLGKAGLAVAAVAGASYLANKVTGQGDAAKVQTEKAAKVQSGKALPVQGVGDVGNIQATPYGMLQKAASGGLVDSAGYLEDGYGGVESDTGVSVTGAGSDTQLIVAKPGEVVLTHKDQENIYSKTGFDVGSYVGKRPTKTVASSNLRMRGGGDFELDQGSVQGYQWGGLVGGIRNRLRGIRNNAGNALGSVGDAVKGKWKEVSGSAQTNLRNVQNTLSGFGNNVRNSINRALPSSNKTNRMGRSRKPIPTPAKPKSKPRGIGRPAGAATMPTPSPMEYGESSLMQIAKQQGIRGKELAAFLAQMAHESGNFKYRNEIGGGKGMGYSGGEKYHGRGYIQLTHDYNYKKYAKELGVDLIKNPELASRPDIAAKIAVSYWKENVRPTVNGNWDDVFLHSKAINYPAANSPSQVNGMSDRENKYKKYIQQLENPGIPKDFKGGERFQRDMKDLQSSRLIINEPNQSRITPYGGGDSSAKVATLPPIVGGGSGSSQSGQSGVVGADFMFSAVSSSSLTNRQRVLATYGVMVG